MKRVFLSILIALGLVCFYLIVASAFVVWTGSNPAPGSYIDLPLRLPKIVFYYFSPPNQQDFAADITARKLVVFTVAMFGNLIVYSIPVYLLLGIFGKKRTKAKNENPPPPPSFSKGE